MSLSHCCLLLRRLWSAPWRCVNTVMARLVLSILLSTTSRNIVVLHELPDVLQVTCRPHPNLSSPNFNSVLSLDLFFLQPSVNCSPADLKSLGQFPCAVSSHYYLIRHMSHYTQAKNEELVNCCLSGFQSGYCACGAGSLAAGAARGVPTCGIPVVMGAGVPRRSCVFHLLLRIAGC